MDLASAIEVSDGFSWARASSGLALGSEVGRAGQDTDRGWN